MNQADKERPEEVMTPSESEIQAWREAWRAILAAARQRQKPSDAATA